VKAAHRALEGEGLPEMSWEAHVQQDTPGVDLTARTIAENVYAAYVREAEGPTHPQAEQAVLARLVEVIRAEVPGGTPRDIIDAANSVFDAWEQENAEIRGPRVSALNRADGSVALT
jgi:hypothetical protein